MHDSDRQNEPVYEDAAAHHAPESYIHPATELGNQIYHSPISDDSTMQSPLSSEHSHYQHYEINGYANDGSSPTQQFAYSPDPIDQCDWEIQNGSGYEPDGQTGLNHYDPMMVSPPTFPDNFVDSFTLNSNKAIIHPKATYPV
jgi:hypothetical protein